MARTAVCGLTRLVWRWYTFLPSVKLVKFGRDLHLPLLYLDFGQRSVLSERGLAVAMLMRGLSHHPSIVLSQNDVFPYCNAHARSEPPPLALPRAGWHPTTFPISRMLIPLYPGTPYTPYLYPLCHPTCDTPSFHAWDRSACSINGLSAILSSRYPSFTPLFMVGVVFISPSVTRPDSPHRHLLIPVGIYPFPGYPSVPCAQRPGIACPPADPFTRMNPLNL